MPSEATAQQAGAPVLIRFSRLALPVALALLFGGCATRAPYDYTVFRQSRPASMLVLPPVNDSHDAQ